MANYIFDATKKLNKEMESKFKKLHEDAIAVWQNKEIKFDLQMMHMGLRRGEVLVDMINGVEDTKGNNGEKGYLVITNLRLLWYAEKSPKTNLSIGYDCITNLEIKQTKSRLRGNVQALFLRTRFKETRYEFIFTSLIENSPRLFTSFQSTLRSYESTKLFRDFKIRGAIIQDKELIPLPSEQLYHKFPGVWNITNEQGHLGTLYISNIRIAWFANLAESFNVSLPFVQVKSIKKKDTNLGQTMILETSKICGSFILTFRSQKCDEIASEISRVFKTYVENPILGLEVSIEEVQSTTESVQQPRVFDDIEIVEPEYGGQSHASAAYYVSENSGENNIIFSTELGLAIESTPNNITIEQLWRII
jgi:Bardet-Biedl syndrome 5 protein